MEQKKICDCCKTNEITEGKIRAKKTRKYCENCGRFVGDAVRKAYANGYNRHKLIVQKSRIKTR